MEYKDYYAIMGLARDATQDQIKRAYRQLARKYHPDVSAEVDAEVKFKELGEAYEVLKDPEKRVAYDKLGHQWSGNEDFRPPPDWNSGFEFSGGGFTGGDASRYSDFFESLFGQGFHARHENRAAFHGQGEDRHAKLQIDLEDSFTGATRVITLQIPELDAQGHVRTREHKLNITIPRGVRAKQQIRLVGQGAAGQDKAGDLYLEIEFRPHLRYRIENSDVYLELPITPWEAALGAKVKIPTPDAVVELKVPANSATGGKLRLKGKGIPSSMPGDLIVILKIVLPPVDNYASKDFYQAMAETFKSFNPREKWGV